MTLNVEFYSNYLYAHYNDLQSNLPINNIILDENAQKQDDFFITFTSAVK